MTQLVPKYDLLIVCLNSVSKIEYEHKIVLNEYKVVGMLILWLLSLSQKSSFIIPFMRTRLSQIFKSYFSILFTYSITLIIGSDLLSSVTIYKKDMKYFRDKCKSNKKSSLAMPTLI